MASANPQDEPGVIVSAKLYLHIRLQYACSLRGSLEEIAKILIWVAVDVYVNYTIKNLLAVVISGGRVSHG